MPGGGRQVHAGEIVFNWQVVNNKVNPPWSINIGDLTFDPCEVGMHEFGHAIRLDHDDTNFDGDTSLWLTGSAPGANAAIIRPAAGMPLASRILGDDKIAPVTGDLTACPCQPGGLCRLGGRYGVDLERGYEALRRRAQQLPPGGLRRGLL
jgi:hypothetical protein